MSEAPILPRSVARWYDPFITVAVIITLFVCLKHSSLSPTGFAVAIVAGTTVPMLLLEWLRARTTLGPRPTISSPALFKRVGVKWLGIMLVVAASIALWWLIPHYRGERYDTLRTCVPYMLGFLAFALIPYLLYTEWRMGESRDYAWHIGLLPLGRFRKVEWRIVRDGVLSMLIRTIFLPFNFVIVSSDSMALLRTTSWEVFLRVPELQQHTLILGALYMLLIVAIVPGYVFSFRLLNTHTRAIDRSWFGWAVTLACYPPLVTGVFGQWFGYNLLRFEDPFLKPWSYFLGDIPSLFYTVAIGIILCELVHLWGEAIIGIRSSNLSHRGVITTGPFRYLRHPIYLIKCIGWWLISLPILAGDTVLECFRLSLLFSGVCTIYYLRSIAEERMLSADPDYVAYALYLDKHGTLAFLGRLCPVFTFRWRHTHWHTRALPAHSNVTI